MFNIFYSIFAIFLFSAPQARAVVGYDTSKIPADHPAYYNTVALVKKINNSYKIFCSSSIANNKILLTAKHCIQAAKGKEIFAYFGDNTNEIDPNLLRRISSTKTYNQNYDLEVSFPSFDFGYIQLEDEIPLIKDPNTNLQRYRPISILTDKDLLFSADEYSLAGFGISETSPRVVAGIKKRVGTQLKDYINTPQFPSIVSVSGTPGHGTCLGDSGGPLYVSIENKWYLIGAASGFDVGLTPKSYKVLDPVDNELIYDCYGSQAIYTFVGDYVNWVEKQSNTSLETFGPKTVEFPGIDNVLKNKKTNKTFSDWCKGTSFLDPSWTTIRQLLYIASESDSEYNIEDILSSCDTAELVLNNMTELIFIEDDFFEDLSPISSLTNIKSLEFIRTKIPNLTPLKDLQLEKLKLYDLKINSIQQIKGLTNLNSLTALNMSNNNLHSTVGINSFKSLETLLLGSNNINDISNLFELENLEVLELHHNKISDITPLLNLTKLKELIISSNKVLSPVNREANWQNLNLAFFSNNQLSNLDFLKKSKNITRLKTSNNPLSN